MRPPSSVGRAAVLAGLMLGAFACAGCSLGQKAAPTRFTWIVGRPEPRFDPQASPDAVRWSLLRLLGHGLVAEDSAQRIVPAAAESILVAPDSLTYTFLLRRGLTFADGTPCGSTDFRASLEAGLRRRDHATQAWLLGAVRGVDKVRPGPGMRTLPPLGIETPDDRTLVLRLARPDSLLLRKLALPGVSDPWRGGIAAQPAAEGAPGWDSAVGLGPYLVVHAEPGRQMVLARARGSRRAAAAPVAPDSIVVRFVSGAGRALSALRGGEADLLWPIPPGFAGYPLPVGWGMVEREATPVRRLLLVQRPDRPPTSTLDARLALAHSLNRDELLSALGDANPDAPWLTGAPAFDFPRLDAGEVREALTRGDFGRSLHVLMTYDADGPAAEVAPAMQGQWARQGLYIDLRPVREDKLDPEQLGGGSHLLLVESQPLLDGLAAELAELVMPARGPGVGAFSTMWRTREFDALISPRPAARGRTAGPRPAPALPVEVAAEAPPGSETTPGALAQRRLAQELVVLPIARLTWRWAEHGGEHPVGFHPHFGPECAP